MAQFINLEDGAVFHMGQGYSRRLISPDSGGRNITLNYSVFQGGQEFPQHFHEVSADIFIVLDGSVSVRQGERYTPIVKGDFAYIPPGEVHGTVNHTDGEATLISFQSPPDPELYSGDRDPAKTGVMPQPAADAASTVRIESMWDAEAIAVQGAQAHVAASPARGMAEMTLTCLELAPGGRMEREEQGGGETVIFIWEGTALIASGGESGRLTHGGAVLLETDEAYAVENVGTDALKLIRCRASA